MADPKGTDPIDMRELPARVVVVLDRANCGTRDDIRRLGRYQFPFIAGCGKSVLSQIDDLLGGVWKIIEPKADYEPEIFCYNCQFYQEDEAECRRHAPLARFEADLKQDAKLFTEESDNPGWNKAAWPFVGPRDWCGEFSAPDEPPSHGWVVQGQEHPTDKLREG